LPQSIVVMSFLPDDIMGKKWHLAALRIEKGLTPEYLILTVDEHKSAAETKSINNMIDKILDSSAVFVYNSSVISQLNSLTGKNFIISELIEVQELIYVFLPLFASMALQEICRENGFQTEKKYLSPAQKNVRLIWEVIKICYAKGLKSDLSFIGKLEEYTRGLGCSIFIEYIKREIIESYPDRPVQTGHHIKGWDPEENGLFDEDINDRVREVPSAAEWACNCFKADGLLSRSFPGYENRDMQTFMAKAITDSFINSTDVVIEAGTGTGKSIAYLIPALWWSKKNNKRVVVATHTINLQEQLFGKDLPFLKKVLPFAFKMALLKGKSNYLCLKAFLYDKAGEELPVKEKIVCAALYTWTGETSAGEFSELPFLNNMSRLYKKYGADNPDCQPIQCSFAGKCFMLKARRRAEEADLIVINHSLLFADIKTKNKILPEYGDLIIDEAHNLYSTALKQLGFEISQEQVQKLSENLIGGRRSLYNSIKRNISLWSEVYPLVNWMEFHNLLEQIPKNCSEVMETTGELFGMLQSALVGRSNLRLSEDKEGSLFCSAVMVSVENLSMRLRALNEVLGKLYSFLSLEMEQLENIRYDIAKNKSEIAQMMEGLSAIITDRDVDKVTYLEKSNILYMKHTGIDIAPVLKKEILDKNNCTVLTSATLTVAGSFDYFAREIGLVKYKEVRLDSPFDYPKQMKFCIVNDIQVNQYPEDIQALSTASFIGKTGLIMNGRTMVLFTSHRYLRLVHRELLKELKDSGLRILAQGIDGSREYLLQDFIKNDRSILLGTSSFWEGVDIPGDSLRCVIMTRLPFWPPDSPIFEAKGRMYESQGRDPFRELHLPEAIIRFKQGFGRLIRTKEDHGAVILLDDRVIRKQYGKSFLKSLPIKTFYRGSSEDIIAILDKTVYPDYNNHNLNSLE